MYGIQSKSFQNKNINALIGCLAVFVFFLLLMILSPDHGGLSNNNVNPCLRIDVIDVGHADAVLIRTPQGKTFLMDGGTIEEPAHVKIKYKSALDFLYKENIKKLDGIILTIWRSDHLLGLIPVMKKMPVACVFEQPQTASSPIGQEFIELCSTLRIKRFPIYAGHALDLGNELFMQILNPEKDPPGGSYSSKNNASIVSILRYGKVQILFAGNIEYSTVKELMRYDGGLKSQIIKVPDHGAETSYYEPFFKAVKSKAAIISVGANNPFGMPSDRVIEAYEKNGAKVYRTDKQGNISIKVGGKDENDFLITTEG